MFLTEGFFSENFLILIRLEYKFPGVSWQIEKHTAIGLYYFSQFRPTQLKKLIVSNQKPLISLDIRTMISET